MQITNSERLAAKTNQQNRFWGFLIANEGSVFTAPDLAVTNGRCVIVASEAVAESAALQYQQQKKHLYQFCLQFFIANLIFTFIWNDYFWAIVLTQGENSQPVTAGITSFNAQFRAMYHLMSAGSIIAALPPVLMFFLMQKHFIAGLTLGAVK